MDDFFIEPVYDTIGVGYTTRRKPDPQISKRIEEALAPCATVLNVGAGTGSYEPPTCTLAVEPSQKMINQRLNNAAKSIRATAEQLPLEEKSFDGALASLTIHHWQDLKAGLAEMHRVARKRIVLFTWDPEFESHFWLTRDYLPEILTKDRPRFPSMRQISAIFHNSDVQIVPIPALCEDGFLGSFWKRPEAHLDLEVQRTNSAMALLDSELLRSGLRRLKDDLLSGVWERQNHDLLELCELDLGYRLVISDLS